MNIAARDNIANISNHMAGIAILLQSTARASKEVVTDEATTVIGDELSVVINDIKTLTVEAENIGKYPCSILKDMALTLEGYSTIIYFLDVDMGNISPALELLSKRITGMSQTLRTIAFPNID